jgi:hypothetical protein
MKSPSCASAQDGGLYANRAFDYLIQCVAFKSKPPGSKGEFQWERAVIL